MTITRNGAQTQAASTLHQAHLYSSPPRRWGGKDEWVAERQAEGVWREVRVYDADDLEQWLELAPAVHIWLSVLLGKHPDDATDLGSFWDDWAAVTEPTTTPEFVLAGRDDVVGQVHEWLRSQSATLALKAESRDESLAVFAAAIQQLLSDELIAYLSRAIVVRTLAAWHRLTAAEDSLQSHSAQEATTRLLSR